jgi:hypothetical protein
LPDGIVGSTKVEPGKLFVHDRNSCSVVASRNATAADDRHGDGLEVIRTDEEDPRPAIFVGGVGEATHGHRTGGRRPGQQSQLRHGGSGYAMCRGDAIAQPRVIIRNAGAVREQPCGIDRDNERAVEIESRWNAAQIAERPPHGDCANN